VSPIYVRPAREQHEHDRLIRFLQRQLQAKHKKKLEIAINPGDEQTTAVKVGTTSLFPDLVLAEGKTLAGIVEIETGESVNNLEAMHQWVPFSKIKVPFHLYVPVPGYDTAKRLMQAYQARVTEIWTYRPANDGFDLVRMHTDPAATSAGKAVKAVIVAVAPKPLPPPPPPEPPPPPPKPVVDLKPAKGGKGVKPLPDRKAAALVQPAAGGSITKPTTPPVVSGRAAIVAKVAAAAAAKAAVSAKSAVAAKPAAPPKAVAPAKGPAPVKAAAKPAKPVAKPAAKTGKPAPKKAVVKAKPAKPAKKKPAPVAAKKKGSAGKKRR
jgi:hypothetical protein